MKTVNSSGLASRRASTQVKQEDTGAGTCPPLVIDVKPQVREVKEEIIYQVQWHGAGKLRGQEGWHGVAVR